MKKISTEFKEYIEVTAFFFFFQKLSQKANLLFIFQLCVIAECGELKEGDDWGIVPQDGSGDAHPDFPEDSDIDLKDVSSFLLRYLFYRMQYSKQSELHGVCDVHWAFFSLNED